MFTHGGAGETFVRRVRCMCVCDIRYNASPYNKVKQLNLLFIHNNSKRINIFFICSKMNKYFFICCYMIHELIFMQRTFSKPLSALMHAYISLNEDNRT